MPQRLILTRSDCFYTLRIFEKYGVRSVFTNRRYDMGFERNDNAAVLGRKDAVRALGVNWRGLVSPSQVHGDSVLVVEKKHRGKGAFERENAIQGTDALVTDEINLPLGILTADCLPVFLFDPDSRAIGLAHAGWKGARQKIVSKTIKKMSDCFGSEPRRLIVALGPSIKPCCYEVGSDFKDYFPGSVADKSGKFYFDLGGAVTEELKACGLPDRNIHASNMCTCCMKSEFFSYRRQKDSSGRSLSAMEIL